MNCFWLWLHYCADMMSRWCLNLVRRGDDRCAALGYFVWMAQLVGGAFIGGFLAWMINREVALGAVAGAIAGFVGSAVHILLLWSWMWAREKLHLLEALDWPRSQRLQALSDVIVSGLAGALITAVVILALLSLPSSTNDLVWEVIAIVAGGLFSGLLTRLMFKVMDHPKFNKDD